MQVYLDNAATTRPFRQVVDAVAECMREDFYNPSALYAPAMQAEKEISLARKAIAATTGALEKHVVFTSGGTESNNLAIMGYLAGQRSGTVLYTAAEHAAVRAACDTAVALHGHTAKEIPLLADGTVDIAALEALLDDSVRLICVMQVCNETGAVMPLADIAALRNRLAPQAALHVDGVQGYLRLPLHMGKLGVQSYAISAHKVHGPKGAGALALAAGHRLHPQMVGGGQQGNLRSGTENVPGIAGLRAAVEAYPQDANEKVWHLKRLMIKQLQGRLLDMVLIGAVEEEAKAAGHILSVAFPPVRAETLVHALEADGVLVGTGAACSSKKGKRSAVLAAMGQSPAVADSAVRISFSPENTEDEILYAAEKIGTHVQGLARFTRR